MARFYVDPPAHPFKGQLYCHLMTDGTEDELRAFAKRLRLRMEWIQKPGTDMVHFDLSPAVRDNAIAAGAVPVSGVEQFRRCVLPKRAPENRAILEEGLKDG
jgi:hypothetical protein